MEASAWGPRRFQLGTAIIEAALQLSGGRVKRAVPGDGPPGPLKPWLSIGWRSAKLDRRERSRHPGSMVGRAYEKRITAAAADVDELGHVNNAVWVRWIQDMATEHWREAADPAHVEAYVWVVIRHEIDYLGALLPGEAVTGRTWVGEAPRGARFDRHVEFVGADGRPRVRARTTWAILDKATGRPLRVPKEVAAPFL